MIELETAANRRGVIETYREFLPVKESTPVVTLLEGGTPLVRAEHISRELGARVYLKLEGLNPTGSFKDRGMTVAVSKALEEKARAVICASTGNTSASAAAYAARAGLDCVVLIPQNAIAIGAQRRCRQGRPLLGQAPILGRGKDGFTRRSGRAVRTPPRITAGCSWS